MKEIKATYENIISETKTKLSKAQRNIYNVGTIRLILFIAGIAGIVYFWSAGWLLIGLVVLLTFVPFLVLVRTHTRLFQVKEYLEKKIEINQQELQALDGDIMECIDHGDAAPNGRFRYSFVYKNSRQL